MIFKKLLMTATILAASTVTALASDIIVDNAVPTNNGTPGAFSYIGHGRRADHNGGRRYDIYSMQVSRVAGIMTVKINTRFVHYNNRGYNFGDLFMSTTGWNPTGTATSGYQADNAFNTGTKWNYVYDLNGARRLTGNNTNNRSAQLHELNDYNMADEDDRDNFMYGSVRGHNEHLYSVGDDRAYASNLAIGSVENNVRDNYLQFVFDVSDTDLATADQMAFHWALSSANDIIEGTVQFAHDTPEPAMLGLMLMGVMAVGFAARRRKGLV